MVRRCVPRVWKNHRGFRLGGSRVFQVGEPTVDSEKTHENVAEIRNALVPIKVFLETPPDEEGLEDAKFSMDRVIQLLNTLTGDEQ